MPDAPFMTAPFMSQVAHLEHLVQLELSIVASMKAGAEAQRGPLRDGETPGQTDLRRQNFDRMREAAAQHQERVDALRAAIAALARTSDLALVSAIRPFAEFAPPPYVPDDHPMTNGSRLAKRQVTAADFRRAAEAYAAAGGVIA